MSRKGWTASRGLAIAVSALLVMSGEARAGTYATNSCVSSKLIAAAKTCQQVFGAWGTWEKDQTSATRDAAITTAGQALATAWTQAESGANSKGADCTETTVTGAAMQADITSAASSIVDSINTGGVADNACRQKLIAAAATACQKLLKAEGKLVTGLKKDPGGAKRDALQSKTLAAFTSTWTKDNCTVSTTSQDVASQLSALDSTAVAHTIVSPTVSDAWTMITPPAQVKYNGKTLAPMCTDGSQYVYFAKKGSGNDVNKLLVYYYGGGACWDYTTCKAPTETPTTGPQDNPANSAHGGFADPTNPDNPFATWSQVAVPYCTGDVHWGNATATYIDPKDSSKSITVQHKGWVNAQVVEKWTREHFVNPDVLFVAGSSAGGYGALLNSLYFLQNAYQSSRAYVFDDAGAGVITPDFQTNNLGSWGVQSTLPTWIPGIGHTKLAKLKLSDVGIDAANYYNPRVDFVQYTTSYDQTQSLFYNLMVRGDADLAWWLSACDWNSKMVANLTAVAGPNYRYYIGAGDTHTVWGNNKVYTDTMGGVPRLVDWVNAMLNGDTANWTNAQCTNCNLEPGDSNPHQPPFAADGSVTCP
jgi:hypothetical protein